MDIVVTVKQVPDPDIPPTHFKVDEAAKKVIPPAGVSPVMISIRRMPSFSNS